LEGRRNKDGIWRRWRREGEQWGKKREEDGSQEKKRKKRNDFFNLSLRVFLVFHLFNIILKIKNNDVSVPFHPSLHNQRATSAQ